jgi:hypothetical protein
MSYGYPPGKVIRRNERLNVTILAEQPFTAMFQCPHLHTLLEGSNPPHRPADEKDTPPATIRKSSKSSASSKRSSRIANSVLSEVADQHVGNLDGHLRSVC